MTEEQERALIAGLKALAETTAEASASPRVEAAVVEAAGRLEPASTAAEAIRAGRLKPASTAAEAVRADWLEPASTAAESVRAGRKKPASPTAESPGRLLVEAGFSRPSSAHVSFGAADTAHVNVSRRTRWFTYAAAAVLLGTVASGVWLARRAHIPTAPIHPSGFVAIPGASALPPIESGSIQRVALHVTELPQYGVAIVPEITVERVQVDLLVAQDGIPRAIRLVDLSEESRSTP